MSKGQVSDSDEMVYAKLQHFAFSSKKKTQKKASIHYRNVTLKLCRVNDAHAILDDLKGDNIIWRAPRQTTTTSLETKNYGGGLFLDNWGTCLIDLRRVRSVTKSWHENHRNPRDFPPFRVTFACDKLIGGETTYITARKLTLFLGPYKENTKYKNVIVSEKFKDVNYKVSL